MLIRHKSFFSASIAFFGALFISAAIAGPVEDGGTLTCSDDTSKANINDIRFPGTGVGNNDYLEVFILEQNVDISNWQLCYTFSGGSGNDCIELAQGDLNEFFYGNPQGDDASPDEFNTGTYLEYEVPNNKSLNPDEGEVLLVNNIDGINVVVDYIQYCQSSTCDAPRWDVEAACGFTLTNHDAGNKDIARLPDGDGDFGDNGDEVTRGDTNDDSAPSPLFSFTMDEALWDGTANEVIDSEGNAAGKAIGDATTTSSSPAAIPGTPGTCGYGTFDGNGDYIEVAALPGGGGDDEDEIELETPSLTFSAWIQTTNNETNQTIFSFGDDLQLTLTPTGKLTFGSDQLNPATLSTADGIIEENDWYFISLVIDPNANDILLYSATQDGSITLVASETNFTIPDEFEIEIEDSGDLTIGGGPGLNSFSGFIDEFNLFGGPLNIDKLADVKAISRPCAIAGLNHYAISHTSPGITCAPTTITVTGHDASNNPIAPANGTTITLSLTKNTTGPGTWSGTGVTPLANGMATYTFDGTQTSADLDLLYPQIDTININVTDGTYSETEDPDLVIQRAIFQWSNINTQISGKPSDTGFNAQTITLQALRASDSDASVCEPGFPENTTVNVNLAAECNDPSSCAGQQMSITNDGNTVDITTNDDDTVTDGTGPNPYTAVPLLFSANATAELVLNYPDAGQMQLHALFESTNPDLALSTYGKSNLFVVRPFSFVFSDINKSGTANPGGTATDGLAANGFVAAEDTFSATVTSVQWQTGEDANNDGIPETSDDLSDNPLTTNFNASPVLSATTPITPVAGTTGTLAGTTNVNFASTGTADDSITLNDLTYSEVGSMSILATLNNYLGASEADIQGTSESIGRFFPDHFTLTSSLITPATGAFSYMGQEFGIDYVLEARGLNNGLTTNYDNNSLGYNGTATFVISAEDSNDGIALDARISTPDPLIKWTLGVLSYTSTAETFARSAVGPDGPYQNLQLSARASTEVDTRNIEALDQKSDQANDCVVDTNCTSKAIGGVTDVRFGRLRIVNTFGSELVPLAIPLVTEYFLSDAGGGGFVTNIDDTGVDSTSYDATVDITIDAHTATLLNYTGGLSAGNVSSPTGAGLIITGLADPANPIVINAPSPTASGSVDISLDTVNWLDFDWDNDGNHDNNPVGTATFGIYRGNDSSIYLRELY